MCAMNSDTVAVYEAVPTNGTQKTHSTKSGLGWKDYSALRASPLRGRPRCVETSNGTWLNCDPADIRREYSKCPCIGPHESDCSRRNESPSASCTSAVSHCGIGDMADPTGDRVASPCPNT